MNNTHIALFLASTLSIALVACSEKNAQQHMQAAEHALAQQQIDTAIIELKNAVKLEPQNGEYRFKLATAYISQRQYPFAEKELEKALDLGYQPVEVVPLLSKIYRKTGSDNALVRLKTKKKGLKARELAQVQFYQLQAYFRLNNIEKAKQVIAEIKTGKASNEYKQLVLVYDLLLNEQSEAASIQLDSVLERYPNQPDALKIKSQLLLSQGQKAQAVALLTEYLKDNDDDLESKFAVAQLHVELGQFTQAEPILDELLAINARHGLLNQLKSAIKLEQQDYKAGLEYAEKALLADPEDNVSRLIAGISSYFVGDYNKVNQHLALVASALPAEHKALRLLADSQLKLGLTIEAQQTVDQFDSFTKQDASLIAGLGTALVNQGKVSQAKALLEQQPTELEQPQAMIDTGLFKLSLRQLDGLVDLETALEKLELSEQAKQQAKNIEEVLVKAYIATGQFDKALEIANNWQKQDALATKGLLVAAGVYIQKGQQQQALPLLQQAQQRSPNDATISLLVVETQSKLESWSTEKVLAKLDELIAQHPDNVATIIKHYTVSKQAKVPETMSVHLTQRLTKQPKNQHLTLVLAQIKTNESQHQLAVELLESIKTDEAKPYWHMLAKAYYRTQNIDKLEALYQDWIKQQPNNTDAILGNALVLQSRNKTSEALAITERYLGEMQGQREDIKLLHTQLLVKSNQWLAAEPILMGLSAASQNLPFAKGVLGAIKIRQQKWAEALAMLNQAYDELPLTDIASNLYKAKWQVEGENAAYQFLQQHAKANQQDVTNIMLLAGLQVVNEPTQAIANYKVALQSSDKNFIAHNNLAYLYNKHGQYDLALQHGEQALAIKPQDVNVLDTVGVIYLQQGQHKKGLEYLAKAVTLMEGEINQTIYVNYVEALLKNEQIELAKRKIAQQAIDKTDAATKLEKLKQQYSL